MLHIQLYLSLLYFSFTKIWSHCWFTSLWSDNWQRISRNC